MANIYENFCYLDQLNDTVIDLTEYIDNFSSDDYTIEFDNRQPAITTVANLFEKYTVVENFKEKNASFTIHYVKEGELPEDLAIQYFGSEDYWWVVTLFNNIKNPLTEWPLTEEQIQYLLDIYTSIENRFTRDAYYNILFDWNETKRRMEVLKADQLNDFIEQFRQEVIAQPSESRFTVLL